MGTMTKGRGKAEPGALHHVSASASVKFQHRNQGSKRVIGIINNREGKAKRQLKSLWAMNSLDP